MGKKKAIISAIYRPGHGKGFFVDFFEMEFALATQVPPDFVPF